MPRLPGALAILGFLHLVDPLKAVIPASKLCKLEHVIRELHATLQAMAEHGLEVRHMLTLHYTDNDTGNLKAS